MVVRKLLRNVGYQGVALAGEGTGKGAEGSRGRQEGVSSKYSYKARSDVSVVLP